MLAADASSQAFFSIGHQIFAQKHINQTRFAGFRSDLILWLQDAV
jgi:hypothetical protein